MPMTSACDIERSAAEWVMRREESDWSPADEVQLQSWLGESYSHKAAYWRLESGWRAARRFRAGALSPLQLPLSALC